MFISRFIWWRRRIQHSIIRRWDNCQGNRNWRGRGWFTCGHLKHVQQSIFWTVQFLNWLDMHPILGQCSSLLISDTLAKCYLCKTNFSTSAVTACCRFVISTHPNLITTANLPRFLCHLTQTKLHNCIRNCEDKESCPTHYMHAWTFELNALIIICD